MKGSLLSSGDLTVFGSLSDDGFLSVVARYRFLVVLRFEGSLCLFILARC